MKHAIKHVHFVGVGGAGMSGIAEILHNLGYRVSGSDQSDSATLRRLGALGIAVFVGHDAANIAGAGAVVTSTAVERRQPRSDRGARGARAGGAACGDAGRTDAPAAAASRSPAPTARPPPPRWWPRCWPRPASTRPSSSAGAWPAPAPIRAWASGDYIVVEADESDASFLNLTPVLAVVTNIDADHMDTYGHDFARLKTAFVDFLHRMPFYGAAIVCGDDPGVRSIVPMVSRPVVDLRLRRRQPGARDAGPGAARRADALRCRAPQRHGLAAARRSR